MDAVEAHDNYFKRRPDATGKIGLSAIQKTTAAIRQLAYGAPADAVDEYFNSHNEFDPVDEWSGGCHDSGEVRVRQGYVAHKHWDMYKLKVASVSLNISWKGT
ncbi:hypothetical protein PsorP6_016058 [Peronosclerospora sorghi]|uniref:Uncharacterized protein n=1 Tax=Peronosclerospora sorghi TaxID=230839 RepID=A0ACC0WQI4_9STRA|nr:hypothetical protein PsorP6_016058 [Peronosclerospora sorghi]